MEYAQRWTAALIVAVAVGGAGADRMNTLLPRDEREPKGLEGGKC